MKAKGKLSKNARETSKNIDNLNANLSKAYKVKKPKYCDPKAKSKQRLEAKKAAWRKRRSLSSHVTMNKTKAYSQ